MSYDIRLAVKVDGYDGYAVVAEPQWSSPTYNLGKMFRACTGWDFKQSEYYKCSEIIGNVEHGIRELRTHPGRYKEFEPDNGWGTISSAITSLESLRECIYETAEYIPLEFLYMRW